MTTSSSGSPNDGRGVGLAIFTGIWTHSSCRLRFRQRAIPSRAAATHFGPGRRQQHSGTNEQDGEARYRAERVARMILLHLSAAAIGALAVANT